MTQTGAFPHSIEEKLGFSLQVDGLFREIHRNQEQYSIFAYFAWNIKALILMAKK